MKTLRVRCSPLRVRCSSSASPRPPSPTAQTGADDATAKLIDEVAAQQTKIVENQDAIDEKIAAIAEEVRQARLFVARGGGNRK